MNKLAGNLTSCNFLVSAFVRSDYFSHRVGEETEIGRGEAQEEGRRSFSLSCCAVCSCWNCVDTRSFLGGVFAPGVPQPPIWFSGSLHSQGELKEYMVQGACVGGCPQQCYLSHSLWYLLPLDSLLLFLGNSGYTRAHFLGAECIL